MPDNVVIEREYLETLLWLARRGDIAGSQRRMWNKFRHAAICSGDQREPDCHSCQAFTAAENALK